MTILRYVFGIGLALAGLNHFINPDAYIRIIPPYLPFPVLLVNLSGIAEIALGILMLIPRTVRLAAWGSIALLIAVFPANIQMALHPESFPDIPPFLLWLRLPVQIILIAWAYYYTRPSDAAVRPSGREPR